LKPRKREFKLLKANGRFIKSVNLTGTKLFTNTEMEIRLLPKRNIWRRS